MASGTGCRAGRMASAGRLACLYRLAPPLPLGAGEYVRSAGVVSVGGEGVGGVVEVLPILCPVVVSSRRPRPSACLLRRPRRHRPRSPCASSSSISAPCALFSSSLPLLRSFLSPPRVLVWFLIASLPVPSTSWAGRSLLACPFVAALVSCLVPSRAPRLACPTVDRSRRRRLCPCPFASARVSSCPVRCLSPFFDKRGRGGGRLAICLLVPRFVLGCGFPVVRACGRAGCCLLASDDGGCRAMSAGVVFGLWCPCLYI